MKRYQKVILASVVLPAGALLTLLAQVPVRSVDPAAEVFTPAHSSITEAARHFFGIRSEPEQPIAFVHKTHEQVEIGCLDCHFMVERGPRASIPDIRTCLSCHAETLTDHPQIQLLKSYYDKGQDIPWQRVYGWPEEAHVRFNHAPHIRQKVECKTCHGDVAEMDVARRAVDHTMGFCVSCHKERQVSIDCLTCHY